jgi:uncharacterized protein involved in response to NO
MVAKHVPFRQGFVWAALAAALGAGFPIGAHLTFVLGFGFPVGKGFGSFIQAHGHVQLIGWAGLMIMGISLHFIPRLAGVPIAHPHWLSRILGLLTIGLGLRSLGQAMLPYLLGHRAYTPVAWLVVASGGLEGSGILGYLWVLLRTFNAGRNVCQRPALRAVRPYFGMMAAGWVLYAGLNLGLLVHMALDAGVVVHPAWNQVAIQSFLGLVLLPVAFAFSVRMLPLYLRLPVPDWPVRSIAYVYLSALVLEILPTTPPLIALAPPGVAFLSPLGQMLKGGSIVWFVWQLDVLTRRRDPWTVHRQLHPGPERRPTRPGLPDYGEFGRFEWLVYAAYAWLVLAAVGDLATGLTAMLQRPWFISHTAIRHLYFLGFITLLIFGMAVRMLPGFLHKRQVAHVALVEATFWLGNAAVLSRVLPFILPPVVLQGLPGSVVIVRSAFAVSGLLGIMAVGCLAVNLWQTAQTSSARAAEVCDPGSSL